METTAPPTKLGPVARWVFLAGIILMVAILVMNADTNRGDSGPAGSCTQEQARFDAAEAQGDPDAMRQADSRMRNGDCY